MNSLISDRKNLILLIALIIIVILSFAFVIYPLSNHLKDSYQNYADKNNEMSALEDKYSSLQELEKDQEDIENANESFLKFIPSEEQTEDIMVSLDALARETSNNLPNFTVEDNKKEQSSGSSQFAKKNLEIDLTGSFDSILTFIQKVEKLQRFTQVNTINLSTSNTKDSSVISISLSLSIFYQK